jgi:hypothetical protein
MNTDSTFLTIVVQGLLLVGAVIGGLGGFTILKRGARLFGAADGGVDVSLDNVLRYLGGMYFGLGLLLLWASITVYDHRGLIYVLAVVVACAGLGRLLSRQIAGRPPARYDRYMLTELALAAAIAIAQYFRMH